MKDIIDANTAVAKIAHYLSEVIAVYPITPSTSMAEQCEKWSSQRKYNFLNESPEVITMQSEAGSIAVLHGSAMCGALSTTFTSSQGLLLMIPTLYKLVGEQTPSVIHVAARSLATHALSIYCDHSDVMATRQTGCVMLASNNGQEAQDMALISHIATLKCSLPFMHFFDGFITSHALRNITSIKKDTIERLFPYQSLYSFRQNALRPDSPTLRGTTADPDSYFQCRERQNLTHNSVETTLQTVMDEFASETGREYQITQYYGDPNATHVIIAIGSVVETLRAYVEQAQKDEMKIGILAIRLYRPFPSNSLLKSLPKTVTQIAVLDRTKEPGASGEPLYLDVLETMQRNVSTSITVHHGRYGLSGKAFYPEDAHAIFTMMKNHTSHKAREFVIGINDDLTKLNLPCVDKVLHEKPMTRILSFGFGGDGSITASKNLSVVLGQQSNMFIDTQFEYDSKKSGNLTTTHIRFSPTPVQEPYPIRRANIISISHINLLRDISISDRVHHGAVVILNTSLTGQALWHTLPSDLQVAIQAFNLHLITIDANRLVAAHHLSGKTSVVMHTAILSRLVDATQDWKQVVSNQFATNHGNTLQRNLDCIDECMTALNLTPFSIENKLENKVNQIQPRAMPNSLIGELLKGRGNKLPVSWFPDNGVWPTNTARLEKRNIADLLPVWNSDLCTQCGFCVTICPHAAIRAKTMLSDHTYATEHETIAVKNREEPNLRYALQVSPDDCTGCQLCVEACPAKQRNNKDIRALNMVEKLNCYEQEKIKFQDFEGIKGHTIDQLKRIDVKSIQTVTPYFEYPNACAGCGETAYIKVLTQLFGKQLLIANATGCSSIFGGNLPTTPYSQDPNGRGPAWANSLFEDNAEFGLGMRLAVNALSKRAKSLIHDLDTSLLRTDRELIGLSDYVTEKQVWMIGGDGWAYDIGFSGIDHVLRSNQNINILVLDTQCYSNTGGQKSKATPQGKTAKLCSIPNDKPAKDLLEIYKHVPGLYLAKIALSANMNQAIKALKAAGEHQGPSLVIAYSPCIEHKYDLKHSLDKVKTLLKEGDWSLESNYSDNLKPDTN
ncbi:pyruvate:ferredoxin (flavodoxin) oxidoreductase [Vibrio alfacsensis]|uniref:pyruvate:ferredoxin (flavodoxin) oxidoreductase n=1 Tax=Vibrio alfacsensis TaxID=1074311 RepID=UPI001C8019A6|nr:pyruvate:ferredoxin (flavodoxin) oxidoreductase [Vibrio alfacsensis]